MKKPQKYWFVNKTYGWGWVPATWQGWLALGIFLLLDVGVVVTFDAGPRASWWQVTSGLLLPVFGLSLILIGICVWTGEKPEWRWGKKH